MSVPLFVAQGIGRTLSDENVWLPMRIARCGLASTLLEMHCFTPRIWKQTYRHSQGVSNLVSRGPRSSVDRATVSYGLGGGTLDAMMKQTTSKTSFF